MITGSGSTQFPLNVMNVLADDLPQIDDDEPTPLMRRPLLPTDPIQAIGVFSDTWMPDEDSYEFRGMPAQRHQPSIERYTLGIHVMAKDTDAEKGQAAHLEMCERVRARLYTGQSLHVALAALATVTSTGHVVRMMRWGVQDLKFLSGEIQSYFYYLGNIRFYFEVEIN